MLYLSLKENALMFSDWTAVKPGNYTEFSYYAGIEPGNPSGDKNLKEIKFFEKNGTLKQHIVYSWNADNNIIKEESLEL